MGVTMQIYGTYICPNTDALMDIGSSAKQWKDLYINGLAYIDGLGEDLDIGDFDLTSMGVIYGLDSGLSIDMSTDGVLALASDGTITITGTTSTTVASKLITTLGRVVNTSRYTTTQTIPVTDHAIFADTDGGAWTATLPAGIDGQEFFITNCGSAGLALTIACNGAETINGDATQILYDGESVHLIFETTENWRVF